MTGPEHYREAELLLDDVKGALNEREGQMADVAVADHWESVVVRQVARAQVHATLALAAATADALPPHRAHGWRGATA